MKPKVHIDWANISSEEDFYETVLPQFEAPDWHGQNLDALWDSIAGGGINGVEPPYHVIFCNCRLIPKPLAGFAKKVVQVFFEAAMARSSIEITISSK